MNSPARIMKVFVAIDTDCQLPLRKEISLPLTVVPLNCIPLALHLLATVTPRRYSRVMSQDSVEKIAQFIVKELRKQTEDLADLRQSVPEAETRKILVESTIERMVQQLAIESDSDLTRNALSPIVERAIELLDEGLPELF